MGFQALADSADEAAKGLAFAPLDIGDEQIGAFSKVQGVGDQAALLRGAQINANGSVISADGRDVTDLYQKYQSNQAANDKRVNDYAAYIKAKQDRPGRDATLLGPQAGTDFGSVLGAGAKPADIRKTVLG